MWRDRFYAVLCGEYGTVGWALRERHFERVQLGHMLTSCNLNGVERRIEIRISPTSPLGENRNDHWTRRTLRTTRFEVRVGYVFTGAGDDYEASGGQDGAGHLDAIEDRAEDDRALIVSALAYPPNYGGLTPHIISLVEAPGGGLTVTEDRAVLVVPFDVQSRFAMPATPPSNPGS